MADNDDELKVRSIKMMDMDNAWGSMFQQKVNQTINKAAQDQQNLGKMASQQLQKDNPPAAKSK
ncbi:MAG: hypothetical protein AB7F28_04625 [Candidatus Margulisiibacteriota bacterium]